MKLERVPFIDLFDQLCQSGMALDRQQYEQFTRAIFQIDFNQEFDPWQRVKQIAQQLWVKPSTKFDAGTFEQIFEQYRVRSAGELYEVLNVSSPPAEIPLPKDTFKSGELPILPPKLTEVQEEDVGDETQDEMDGDIVSGMQIPETEVGHPVEDRFQLMPKQFPISGAALVEHWQIAQASRASILGSRVDYRQTQKQLIKNYPLIQLAFQPQFEPSANLVVLIDRALSLRPFLPFTECLVRDIRSGVLTSAYVFEFLHFPNQYLYPHKDPLTALGLDEDFLVGLFHHQTTLVIISDAGAVRQERFVERTEGMLHFLEKMKDTVGQIISINPMPRITWRHSSATDMAACSAHTMLSLNELDEYEFRQILRYNDAERE